jgi:ribonuclease HII
MLCGCDEAGRGPVIGPMVVAVVCGDQEIMRKIGVRDSKKLTQFRRENLNRLILEKAESVNVKIVSEKEIDDATKRNELNLLEAKVMASMFVKGNSYIVDCPDVNEARFAELLSRITGIDDIISRHKADVNFPMVSAASIVAKVRREEEINKIKEEIGEFGSGYPSDSRTIDFLRTYFSVNKKFPPHVRQSWKTLDRINSTLSDY